MLINLVPKTTLPSAAVRCVQIYVRISNYLEVLSLFGANFTKALAITFVVPDRNQSVADHTNERRENA